MEYRLKSSLKNIDSYIIKNNQLVYSSGDKLRNKELFINGKKLDVIGVTDYDILDEKIFYNLWQESNKCFVYNTVNNEYKTILNCEILKVYKEIIICKDITNKLYHYFDKDLNKLFSGNFFHQIYTNFGFFYNNNGLSKISTDNKVEWQISFSDLFSSKEKKADEIKSLLGIAHNNLWLYSKLGRVVALSLESGAIVKIFSGNKSDVTENDELHNGFGSVYLNEDDGHIYSLSNDEFKKINTQTLKVENVYKFRETNPSGMGQFEYVYSPLLQGQYFTFLGDKYNDHGTRHIGLFDYLKKELVWEYEVISKDEKKKGNTLISPQPLRISGNKLYVKDIQDTLYIFEKEQDLV